MCCALLLCVFCIGMALSKYEVGTELLFLVFWDHGVACLTEVQLRRVPPPPVSRNQQYLTAEPGGGSCARFPPKIRPRNQGLVLAHDRGQPRTAEKKNSGALHRGMRTLSFPTVNHIDK